MTARRANPSKEAKNALDLSTFRQVSQETGPSLDQLSAAFAGLLDSGSDPYSSSASSPVGEITAVEDVAAVEDAGDACTISPLTILEAMLFVGSPDNEPLTASQVAGLMRGVRPAEIDALVRELNRDYESRNCPYTIAAEGAGYRMKLRDEHARTRDTFFGRARAARLSQAAIDILAIVAYHEPITADEISRLRGKPGGHVLLGLVRRQLLRLERDGEKPRRVRYFTTPRFLELFGLTSLADLPQSRDLEQS
jgi:segregation and condensation protein B